MFMMISDFFCFFFFLFFLIFQVFFSLSTASSSKFFNRPQHDERQRETEQKTVDCCELFQRCADQGKQQDQNDRRERWRWGHVQWNVSLGNKQIADPKVLQMKNCTIYIKLSFSIRHSKIVFTTLFQFNEVSILDLRLCSNQTISISMNRFMFQLNECRASKVPLLIHFT